MNNHQSDHLRNHVRHFAIAMTVSWLLLIFNTEASAQKSNDESWAIRDILRDRIANVLKNYVGEGNFTIQLEVKSKDSNPKNDIFYALTSKSAKPLSSLSARDLSAKIKSLGMRIGLPKSFEVKAQQELKVILTQDFVLDEKRGDQIQFFVTNLAKKIDDSAQSKDTARLDSELRNAKTKAEDLRKERDDLKHETQLSKSELDRLARELNLSKQQKKPQNRSVIELIREQSPSMIGYGLLFLAMIFLGFGISKIATRVGTSIGAIAQALGVLGGKIGGSGNADSVIKIDAAAGNSDLIKNSGDTRQTAGSHSLTEGVMTRLGILRNEISELLKYPGSETLVLQFLTDQLRQDQNVSRAILVFELLGREIAHTLYQSLSQEGQNQVMRFLKTQNFATNKHEMMLDVGEELKTKILMETLKKPEDTKSDLLLQDIVRLNSDQRYELIFELQADALARYLSFFDSAALGGMLAKVFRDRPQSYPAFCDALLQIPKATSQVDQDPALHDLVKRKTDESRLSLFKPYLKSYLELLESQDDEIVDETVARFRTEKEVADYLSENLVTLNTLFKLSQNQSISIVSQLTVKDIASIANGLIGPSKDQFFNLVSKPIMDLVREELTAMQNMSKTKIDRLFKSARGKIVAIMKALKANGEIEFAAPEGTSTDSSANNDDSNQRAA